MACSMYAHVSMSVCLCMCVFVCISQMHSEHFRRYQRFSAFFYMFFVCYMRLTQLCPNVDRIKAQSQLQSQSLLSPLHSHSCSCSCCCTVAHSPCLTLLRFVVFTAVRTHKKEKLLQRICHQKMQEEEAEEVCLAWRSFMCNCMCVHLCLFVCHCHKAEASFVFKHTSPCCMLQAAATAATPAATAGAAAASLLLLLPLPSLLLHLMHFSVDAFS